MTNEVHHSWNTSNMIASNQSQQQAFEKKHKYDSEERNA
jgi:hypothetical protein